MCCFLAGRGGGKKWNHERFMAIVVMGLCWNRRRLAGGERRDGLLGAQGIPATHHLCCWCGCGINRHRLNIGPFLSPFNKPRRLATARAMHLTHTPHSYTIHTPQTHLHVHTQLHTYTIHSYALTQHTLNTDTHTHIHSDEKAEIASSQ